MQSCVIEINKLYHKYYLLMYGLLSISEQECVEGIGEMDQYNDIHTSNIDRKTNENAWLDRESNPGPSPGL